MSRGELAANILNAIKGAKMTDNQNLWTINDIHAMGMYKACTVGQLRQLCEAVLNLDREEAKGDY